MKILHIIPHIHNEASGPSYSVTSLAKSLSRFNNHVEIDCLSNSSYIDCNLKINYFTELFGSTLSGISINQPISLLKKSSNFDLIHNHSLWSMINFTSGFLITNKKVKYVVSPRGTLSNWSMNYRKIKKKIFWPLQKKSMNRADIIHVTSNLEYDEVRSLGFKQPIMIIPNGMHIPDNLKSTNLVPKNKTLLFLSRIHYKKGIENLIKAWKLLQNDFPDWSLIIVGEGEEWYVNKIKNLIKLNKLNRVAFKGPLYGSEKFAQYNQSNLFILPSFSENFGMVIAESLACSCPVITTKNTPWDMLEEFDCGWSINNDLDSICKKLRYAMQLNPKTLKQKGINGKNYIQKNYSWDLIGNKFNKCYNWISNGGEVPTEIKFN